MNHSHALLHLSLIDGIGPVAIKTILASGLNPADLYAASSRDLVERCGVSLGVAQKVVAGLSSHQELDAELQLLERHRVNWTTLGSAEYPALLAAIHAPPAVIYWRGAAIFNEQKTIAFVGSRKAHRYAEQVIDAIVPELVAQNWVIVSGGALGADSMAHRATVRAGGRTVAILGSGLLHPYPASNTYLFDDIVAHGGALVSCFPLATEAMPGLFPARNRIIAGMSRGCVVVQAASKSGALITAHCALEQGREVFSVPGPLGDELSSGCNDLIQQGAKLIRGAADIIDEFTWFSPGVLAQDTSSFSVHTQAQPQQAVNDAVYPEIRPVIKPGAGASMASGTKGMNTRDLVQEDTSPEGIILAACKKSLSTDDIALLMHEDIDVVQGLLFELQLTGKIQQNFAGLWERL